MDLEENVHQFQIIKKIDDDIVYLYFGVKIIAVFCQFATAVYSA